MRTYWSEEPGSDYEGKRPEVAEKASESFASRSSSNGGGTNNLPPLLFHNVHGENIRISRDGTIAKRAESFCKGVAFSSRPIRVNEKVCIKFLEISINWSGVLRFGFTYNDPSGLRTGLPKYACPDLTNKPGYWAKALPERFASRNTILFYYVTSAGDVHFGINGEEKGIFFSGVDTRGPLWALIDVYGNSTAIEFVDIRHNLNNSRRNINNANNNCDETETDDVNRIVYPMQQISLQQRELDELPLPALRYQSNYSGFHAMAFHRTHGKNVKFNSNRTIAMRSDNEFCQGYVFTARPLQIGERIVVQILGTEPMFQGCLAMGLTSCDPATLQSSDLPDDSNCLLDRPEYWVISRDFSRNLLPGDEISFRISFNGEVQISRNGGSPLVVIHVDQTLRLWAFFDVFGSTQKIRVVSSPNVTPVQNPEYRMVTPSSESMNSLNSNSEMRRNMALQNGQPSNTRVICVPQSAVQANGAAIVLPQTQVTNIPASPSISSVHSQNNNGIPPSQLSINYSGHSAYIANTPLSPLTILPPAMANVGASRGQTYSEPLSDMLAHQAPLTWVEQNGTHPIGAGTECTICYENPIDAVLYMCGHMCMCYECALQQWRGKGGGHCPLCRAVIRDVIRTYKS